ncbi:alpha-(1,3)-fucosyltransferase C-like [Penaeus japonicus]|uniref:alpha-(1,3)-fucosyltransferase C-like n=1 Tax=Penaeus japonicus TaxID=27405 RepID=UPI001C711C24|nr:alpha-(1,3)-fucosyltransferase C-like [Penaeus japonicus]
MLPKNKFYVVLPLVFMAGFYKSGLFTNYTSSLKPALTFVAPEEASSPQYKGIKVKESQDIKFGYISESLYQNSTGSQESPSNMSGMNREANIPHFETHNRGGESAEESITKKILFYTKFFDEGWKTFLGNRTNLTLQGCPETRCVFTFDPAEDDPSDADALIFHANDFDVEAVPRTRRPHQRYVWLNLEAPAPQNRLQNRRHWVPNFFNWTLTYNRDSHLFMPYGVLTPLRAEEQDISGRPSLLNRSSKAFLKYMQDLSNNVTLEDDLQHDWSSFLRRPKVVAWMVSNCHTWSGEGRVSVALGCRSGRM